MLGTGLCVDSTRTQQGPDTFTVILCCYSIGFLVRLNEGGIYFHIALVLAEKVYSVMLAGLYPLEKWRWSWEMALIAVAIARLESCSPRQTVLASTSAARNSGFLLQTIR